jgi:acetyl-CoA synthetase
VKAVVEGKPIGDITTLDDDTSVEEMKNAYGELQAQLNKGK